MKHIFFLSFLVFVSPFLPAFAQQQDDFPIGIYTSYLGDSLNYQAMDTSLHLTWLQGPTGAGTQHYLDNNPRNLKVIAIRWNTLHPTASHHMKYQAEDVAPSGGDENMRNYFGTKLTGELYEPDENAWYCRVAPLPNPHQAGIMVRHPRPKNDFHYNAAKYIAKFNMAIDKGQGQNPTDTVAVLSVYTYYNNVTQNVFIKTLRDSNFAAGFSTYYEFRLPFNLNISVCNPPCVGFDSLKRGPLGGGMSAVASNILCDSIDVQVNWRGHRTTWLDYVVIDDSIADELFAGQWNARIGADIRDYVNDPQGQTYRMKRLYVVDEPYTPAFLPIKYVDNVLHDSGFTGTRGRAITAAYNWNPNSNRRFVQEATPHELMLDRYVIENTIPCPSMTNGQDTSLNVTPYQSNAQYNSALQSGWDSLQSYYYAQSASARNANPPIAWWHIPQLHGIYNKSSGHYRGLRSPTGTEIQAQINIGIALGSKGVISYPFGTDYYGQALDNSEEWGTGLVSRNLDAGKFADHAHDTTSLPVGTGSGFKSNIWTGYKQKWDSLASINQKLQVIGQTLKNLDWQGAKSWWSNTTYGTWSGIVTSLGAQPVGSSPDTPPAVLIGHMQSGSTNYLYVVNRRCDTKQTNIDTRDISMTINGSNSHWLVTEMRLDTGTVRAWVLKNNTAFKDRFNPGEGKLYKLESATVSGTKTFSQLKFVGGGVLTLASSANITARGNMDTVNIVLGSSAIFKADTGSTMIIARDSAFVFGSGSQLEISGLLRTTYGNYTTVPYGATLRIRPGAVLQWGSYGSLVIEGTFSAIGTVNNPIIVTKAPGGLAPAGIRLSVGSLDTLEHCRITGLNTGVSIAYCTARVRNNAFINCNTAIYSDAFKRSPWIESNTIDSCYIGLDIFTTSTIGMPTLQGNDIQHCEYGIVLNPSYSSTLSDNRVHSNQTGVLVSGSTPVLRGNIIESNVIDGVFATNYSNPRFGDYSFNDPGKNVIRYNGATQIHSSFSQPFLGEIFYEPRRNCGPLDPSTTLGGFNSIYDPNGHSYLVFTGKGSSVTAIGTWWGVCPPDDIRFFSDGWPLYYLPALDYDPNPGMRPSILLTGGGKVGQESGQLDPRSRNTDFRQALLLRSRHNYAGAVALYSTLVASNLNEVDAHTAMAELRNTYHDYIRWSNDTTLQGTLESYLRTQSTNHPRAAIKRFGKVLKSI